MSSKMMYELQQDLHIKDKVLKAGDVVEAKEIPKVSLSWLLEQDIIIKVDKNYKEKKLQELKKQEEE
tara:strand:- start:1321 stop:1521 length:201 start_codon:yes stop_codon:yes gene_type:complete